MARPKLIRITTVPQSLATLLKGQLAFMSQKFEVIGVSSPGRVLDTIAANEGVRTVGIEMTRRITPLKDMVAVWKLYRLFRREKPAIVHTHTPKAGTVGMLAAWLAGVPNRFHTVAGLPLLEATGRKRTLLDLVEKMTYRCAAKVYPNSEGLARIILENGYTRKDKLKVIGNGSSNGIDTSFFDPSAVDKGLLSSLKKELGITDRDFVFIFVGRLVGDKGINELVAAFDVLSASYPHAKLLLVGQKEAELDPLNEETIRKIETHDSIVSAGHQMDVRPYFAVAHALVFPSYREGFPNVVMQAGAMGLAAIVTDINGCNEIVVHGENGLVIPPKNREWLLSAMRSLIEDEELRKGLSARARRMITERYGQSMVWNAILEEYESHLDVSPHPN